MRLLSVGRNSVSLLEKGTNFILTERETVPWASREQAVLKAEVSSEYGYGYGSPMLASIRGLA